MRTAIKPIAAGLLAWTIVLAVATRSFATPDLRASRHRGTADRVRGRQPS